MFTDSGLEHGRLAQTITTAWLRGLHIKTQLTQIPRLNCPLLTPDSPTPFNQEKIERAPVLASIGFSD